MADQINKAKKRASSANKAKYAAQYTITYKNKVRAIKRHIEALKVARNFPASADKVARIDAEIEACNKAIATLPLKKGG